MLPTYEGKMHLAGFELALENAGGGRIRLGPGQVKVSSRK
jgi:hypothetical protein